MCDKIDQLITDILRISSLASGTSHGHGTPTYFYFYFLPHPHLRDVHPTIFRGWIQKVLEMSRSSLAHERQSIIQSARIADLEHELARLRAGGTSSASASSARASTNANGTGSPAAGRGPVASHPAPAASSDAPAPTTQKGRWWALGWR